MAVGVWAKQCQVAGSTAGVKLNYVRRLMRDLSGSQSYGPSQRRQPHDTQAWTRSSPVMSERESLAGPAHVLYPSYTIYRKDLAYI